MIIDFLYTLGMLSAFFVLGIFFVRAFFGEINADKVFLATLMGLAFTIICGTWLLALSIDLKWLLPVLMVIMFLGYLIMRLKGQRLGKFDIVRECGTKKSFFVYLAIILASGFVYIFLQNNQLLKARLAVRAGPDLVGWVSAGQKLCQTQNLSLLAQTIRQQLHIPNVLLAFRDATTFPLTSIDRIPSFTEQINAEFLIGAHRFGLPAFQGGVCRVLGADSVYHLTVAMMAISAILIATIATLIIKNFSIRMELKVLTIFLCAVNVNIISVSMEGGFGQLVATPFLLFFLLCLGQPKWRKQYLPIALFLLLGYALSTYLDVLYAAGPLAFIYVVVQIREDQRLTDKGFSQYLKIRGKTPRLAFACFSGLVAGWPLWPSLLRLVVAGVSGAGAAGGWDQGRVPLPSDFGGFFNWLPSDGANNTPRGLGLGILEVSVCLFMLYILMRSKDRIFRNIIFTVFYVYLALIVIVYKNATTVANNYTIWKMSAYLSSLVMLALVIVSNTRTASNIEIPTDGNSRGTSPLWVRSGLALAAIATLGWSLTWLSSRQYSFDPPTPQQQAFFNNYDVEIFGFYGASTTKFALQGDIRYLENPRAAGVPTMRSVPKRPLAFVYSPESCQTMGCIGATTGFGTTMNLNTVNMEARKIGTNKIFNGDFHLWNLGTSFKTSGVTADGWLWAAGVAGVVSRQMFTSKSVQPPTGTSQSYLRWEILKNSINDQIFQKISDVHTLAGQTVVLSFWARQTHGSTSFKAHIYQDFGTGGSPSAIVGMPGTVTPKLTSTWQRVQQVFQVPAVNDKTIGTHNDSFLWVNFQADTVDSGQLDLSDVELGQLSVEKRNPFKRVFISKEFNAYVQNER